jgi:hypothetical protein
MLVTLRDRGLPLPAGAILISPWADLTHSFPSVAGDNPMDYIPPYGFQQRPSPSWPPPNSDDMLAMAEGAVKKLVHKDSIVHMDSMAQSSEQDAVQGFHVNDHPDAGTINDDAVAGTATHDGSGPAANTIPGHGHELSIIIEGKLVEIKDQIQMYATNQLISHPLVSPVLQPSLGGLPPLLILTGGGEALKDEQIYLAHKAANPAKYPPGDAFLDEIPFDHNRDQIGRWKPTDVQLQVWDDLCHVAPTLSFTRPAKYMYRSVAQFGAWALARAQHTEIEILDDDSVSIISKSDTESDFDAKEKVEFTFIFSHRTYLTDDSQDKDIAPKDRPIKAAKVGKAGDPLPAFRNHMIRQRVDRHGHIYPLEHHSSLPGCCLPPSEIGIIKEGPVRKWMAAKLRWDTKYAHDKRRVQKQRAREMMEGYQTFGNGEVPPPSALAGRRRKGDLDRDEKRKMSWGMSLWSLWGSKHDKEATVREQQANTEPESTVVTEAEGANARPLHDIETQMGKAMADQKKDYSRSRSRSRTVTDEHQTDQPDEVDENSTVAELLAIKKATEGVTPNDEYLSPEFIAKKPAQDAKHEDPSQPQSTSSQTRTPAILTTPPPTKQAPSDPEIEISKTNRPKSNGIAFPFKLNRSGTDKSVTGSVASTTTLTSALGVTPLKPGSTGSGDGKDGDKEQDRDKGKGKENVKDGGAEERPG